MSNRFTVQFRDGNKLKINECISFEPRQIDEVITLALEYTQEQLQHYEQEGADLSYLTELQKKEIINHKNNIIASRSIQELRDKNIVRLSKHALQRMLEREGSNELTAIINLIRRVIASNSVLKAQFKGFPQLAYTLFDSRDSDQYKLPVSMQPTLTSRKKFLKVITLIPKDVPPKNMVVRISEDEEITQKMEILKKKLTERLHEKHDKND